MKDGIIDFATATTGSLPRSARAGQPVIGLSVNVDGGTSRLHEAYIRSVAAAGGITVLIPATEDADTLREIVGRIDGLVLTGGSDIDGRYFGEQTLEGLTDVNPLRDTYDFLLLRLAADHQLPVLGICRGMQVINVAFGGGLCQDIPSQFPGEPLNHSILTDKEKPVHTVRIAQGSRLAAIFGCEEIGVNSRHHQAVQGIAPDFTVSAIAPDGVVEAIEGYPLRRILGVQWHPENMAADGADEGMQALFRFIVGEAALFARAKHIHARHLTVDSHCDTPMLFAENEVNIGRRDPVAKVDLVKMGEGGLDAVFVVAYLPQGPRQDFGIWYAPHHARELLEAMQAQIGSNADYVGQARTFAEADALKAGGKRVIFLAIENGYAIGSDLANLDRFRRMGVTYMTLCHNGANDLCDSCSGEPEHGGLSPLGREVVARMNRLGMAIDLSHAADTTVRDVLEASAAPVIASHSSARALCDHPRNLTDDHIRAIAAKGGVVQVCLYGGFLARGREATLLDAVDHIDHIIKVGGIACAGIGSDFDGGGGIPGCQTANELINITVELLCRGYTEEQIAAIWGGNLRRTIDRIQSLATE